MITNTEKAIFILTFFLLSLTAILFHGNKQDHRQLVAVQANPTASASSAQPDLTAAKPGDQVVKKDGSTFVIAEKEDNGILITDRKTGDQEIWDPKSLIKDTAQVVNADGQVLTTQPTSQPEGNVPSTPPR